MDKIVNELSELSNDVERIQFLNSGNFGFGPGGTLTRESWREVCRKNFERGSAIFNSWQAGLSNDINADFSYVVFLKNKTHKVFTSEFYSSCALDLIGCEFTQEIDVERYIFLYPVLCNFSKFCDAVSFNNASFRQSTSFFNTNFKSFALFNKTEFSGDTDFRRSVFLNIAVFMSASFESRSYFDGSLFLRSSNFENTLFKNVGHFEEVTFQNEIPSFLGAKNAETRLEFSSDKYFNKLDISSSAIKRISQLKRLSEEHGQTDQALMFNAFELNAKRAQARVKTIPLNFFKKLNNSDYWFANATAFYEVFSDYGRSFVRPICAYLILLFFTVYLALVNAIFFSANNCEGETWYFFTNLKREQISCEAIKDNKTPLTAYRAAGEYAVYRASGIFDFSDNGKATDAVAMRLFGQAIEPWWMRIWGIFKGVASLALLFLAALGLRNKYRIK